MKGCGFYSVSWIFISYFLIEVIAQQTCNLLDVQGLEECDLTSTHQCCRWDSASMNLETMCCPKQLKCPTQPKRYDEPTCYIPQCFPMSYGETCDKDVFLAHIKVFINSEYNQLPAGADSVAECCEINEINMNQKNDAECCIVFGGRPKCTAYFETDKCSSAAWK